jgi:hypothetical protein
MIVTSSGQVDEAISVASSGRMDTALLDIRVQRCLISPVARLLDQRGVPFVLTSAYRVDDIPPSLRRVAHLHKHFTEEAIH